MLVPLVIVTVVSALLCGIVAYRRRASAGFWFIAGLLAGPLALPFVFFAKPVASRHHPKASM